MTSPRFLVRLFNLSPESNKETIEFIGNFKQYGNRQNDEVVVFTGMYGLTSYMLWYVHGNLPHYDFSTVGFDLRLFLEGTTRMPYWTGTYRHIHTMYSTKQKRYMIFCVSEDDATLETKLTDFHVKSLKYIEGRQGEDVLKEVLEPYNIFRVHYFKHDQEVELDNFQYPYFNIDENWTVHDFINYICDENEFEWLLRNNVLYVGKELRAFKDRRSGRKFDMNTDHFSTSSFFHKYAGETRPMDVLSHIDEEWRCVWVRHSVGRSGGSTRGCFTAIGAGTLNKKSYFDSLEGDYEKQNATKLLSHNSPSHYILLGNILKDSGSQKQIDEVSIQTPMELMKVTDPNLTKFERGTEKESVSLMKERIARSTQYADNEAGLLFPSSKLEEGKPPPNSLIFNIQGKEHMSVIGPFVMGTETEEAVKIPVKEKEDFRLRFPDGAEIFYDASTQNWFIQAPMGFVFKQAITTYDKEPARSRLKEEENMFQIYDGNLLFDTSVMHVHMMHDGCFQVIPKSGPAGSGNRKFAIFCDNDNGEVRITALNDLKLWIEDGLDNISSGNIDINTTKVGGIKLGGGGNKISHGNHTHILAPGLDGLFSLPLKGSCTQHLPPDGSNITEVD